jgi:phage N-6-adenine-methyltransferase
MVWGTPWDVFEAVHKVFNFQIDAAAADYNAKIERFFSEDMDALSMDWVEEAKRLGVAPRFWLNPPYGRGEEPCPRPFKKCKKKACKERGHHIKKRIPSVGDFACHAAKQADNGATVGALLPARTGKNWYFDHVWDRADALVFWKGRIKFLDRYGKPAHGASFPSVLAIYGQVVTRRQLEPLRAFGKVVVL